MSVTPKKAEEIVSIIATKVCSVMKQELEGYHEENLDRILRKFRSTVARYNWKNSQKWSKWNDDGPILMPDYTRIYYRKGKTELLLQEFPPQTRLMKFTAGLASRDSSTSNYDSSEKVHTFSLALPYIVFIFQFVDGLFVEVRCAFCDRPLKSLEERPLRPYLSNLNSNLQVCLGHYDRTQLIQGNLTQQAAYILDHFWSTTYCDEWSSHYWASKSHFQDVDPRLASLQKWEEASQENPLFVVEDAQWLEYQEESFGDIFVGMLNQDSDNQNMHEELYRQLTDDFFEDFKRVHGEDIDKLKTEVTKKVMQELTQKVMEML